MDILIFYNNNWQPLINFIQNDINRITTDKLQIKIVLTQNDFNNNNIQNIELNNVPRCKLSLDINKNKYFPMFGVEGGIINPNQLVNNQQGTNNIIVEYIFEMVEPFYLLTNNNVTLVYNNNDNAIVIKNLVTLNYTNQPSIYFKINHRVYFEIIPPNENCFLKKNMNNFISYNVVPRGYEFVEDYFIPHLELTFDNRQGNPCFHISIENDNGIYLYFNIPIKELILVGPHYNDYYLLLDKNYGIIFNPDFYDPQIHKCRGILTYNQSFTNNEDINVFKETIDNWPGILYDESISFNYGQVMLNNLFFKGLVKLNPLVVLNSITENTLSITLKFALTAYSRNNGNQAYNRQARTHPYVLLSLTIKKQEIISSLKNKLLIPDTPDKKDVLISFLYDCTDPMGLPKLIQDKLDVNTIHSFVISIKNLNYLELNNIVSGEFTVENMGVYLYNCTNTQITKILQSKLSNQYDNFQKSKLENQSLLIPLDSKTNFKNLRYKIWKSNQADDFQEIVIKENKAVIDLSSIINSKNESNNGDRWPEISGIIGLFYYDDKDDAPESSRSDVNHHLFYLILLYRENNEFKLKQAYCNYLNVFKEFPELLVDSSSLNFTEFVNSIWNIVHLPNELKPSFYDGWNKHPLKSIREEKLMEAFKEINPTIKVNSFIKTISQYITITIQENNSGHKYLLWDFQGSDSSSIEQNIDALKSALKELFYSNN